MFETAATPTHVSRSIGFQWGDAGIGAGFTLGIVLLIGALAPDCSSHARTAAARQRTREPSSS